MGMQLVHDTIPLSPHAHTWLFERCSNPQSSTWAAGRGAETMNSSCGCSKASKGASPAPWPAAHGDTAAGEPSQVRGWTGRNGTGGAGALFDLFASGGSEEDPDGQLLFPFLLQPRASAAVAGEAAAGGVLAAPAPPLVASATLPQPLAPALSAPTPTSSSDCSTSAAGSGSRPNCPLLPPPPPAAHVLPPATAQSALIHHGQQPYCSPFVPISELLCQGCRRWLASKGAAHRCAPVAPAAATATAHRKVGGGPAADPGQVPPADPPAGSRQLAHMLPSLLAANQDAPSAAVTVDTPTSAGLAVSPFAPASIGSPSAPVAATAAAAGGQGTDVAAAAAEAAAKAADDAHKAARRREQRRRRRRGQPLRFPSRRAQAELKPRVKGRFVR